MKKNKIATWITLTLFAVSFNVGPNQGVATAMPMPPSSQPDYFNVPNYANSPMPTVSNTGAISGGIRKFVDSLPGLGSANANNLGNYIPIATADTQTYPGSDYYEIGLSDYSQIMHWDIPATKLRGYKDLLASGTDADNHYLGPIIIAHKDKPVRVKFINQLAAGSAGDLFLPVDTTVMGAGMGPDAGFDYQQNRATLHLHGGDTPWISDGTPHQWTVPQGDTTAHYQKGVSTSNVPDMENADQGEMTFYWPNRQSGRMMFYHDHAFGITRLNVYAGEAAGYLIVDPTEDNLINTGILPNQGGGVYNYGVPLVIQDKTFVDATKIASQDPTWNWGSMPGMPMTGDLWFPHVYMPNQNPNDPMGVNAMGRWDYGPWFNPAQTGVTNGPITLPNGTKIPGVPNVSYTPEGYHDTPLVNGCAYPYLTVQPTAYRFRVLNAANDRFWNLHLFYADTGDGSGAAATASVTNGAVSSINVVNPGTGYASAPGVYIFGGGGSGATAIATSTVLPAGLVTNLTLTNGGSNYFYPPTVSITGGGGSGAAATATINGNIRSIQVTNSGSGYTIAPTVSFTGGGGSGAAANAYLAGSVNSIALLNGGSGYTSAPSVVFGGNGFGATATATITATVNAVNVGNYGSGYTSVPTVSLTGGGGTGATAAATITGAVKSLVLGNGGSGYSSAPTVNFTGGGGAGATAQSNISGVVSAINVTNGGSGYTSAPSVTIYGYGTGARATATVSNGQVTAVHVTYGGGMYTNTPAVYLNGGGGHGATATAVLSASVVSVSLLTYGTGYTSAPTVSFSGGSGTGALATAGISGIVSSITVTNPGTNYTSAPTVSITGGGGTGAQAQATISGSITSLTLINNGQGYTNPPPVFFQGGGGSGASASTTIATSLFIGLTNAGSGYTTPPDVVLTGGDGTGATATATIAGSINSVTLTAQGSGYTSEPTLGFSSSGGGSSAAATATITTGGAIISGITVTNGGTGYTSAPTVLIGSSTEVKMVPAVTHSGDPAWPATWPTDGRDGGVPDPTRAGPSIIQIGTEGGLLPAPVVIPPQPVTWDANMQVEKHSLYLGPAERADIIIDFSKVKPGSKLILYNDAPAPVPSLDPRWDYYTGDPDQTSTGGAPTTIPGYGPNTRTVMQFVVDPNGTPTPAFDVAKLNTAFASTGSVATNNFVPGAFAASQPEPIVPESDYNSAYNANYADSSAPKGASTLTFTPAGSNVPETLRMEAKGIIEPFEPAYGRGSAQEGVYSDAAQVVAGMGNMDQPTEVLKDGVPQIWRVVHNGMDTHPIHFHLFNVQVLERIAGDGTVTKPEPNELGWKDTVKMRAGEDTLVAFLPKKQDVPFLVPSSVRPLDPTTPLGSTWQSVDINNNPVTVTNALTNFGGEYVWHCHILGHEENDMMRPMVFQAPPPGSSPIAVANLDGDPKKDAIFIFGPNESFGRGLWVLYNNANWVRLHDLSPDLVSVGDLDGNGIDDLIFGFGPLGIWVYYNNSTWVKLHDLTAKNIVAGDLDGDGKSDLIVDFGPKYGIWVYYNNASWSQLHPISAKSMLVTKLDANDQQDLVIDFGDDYGIWIDYNNGNWQQLHPLSAKSMAMGNICGSGHGDLVIDFGPAYGIWLYCDNSTWSQLHPMSAKSIVTGDLDANGTSEVIVDFGPQYGIWAYYNNSSWTQLHNISGSCMKTGNIDGFAGDDLIVGFGPYYGTWVYSDNSTWTWLNSASS